MDELQDTFCKSKFSLPLTSWLSWDDMLNLIYFALNLSIVILATVNSIKKKNNDISEEESNRIILSQKILRLIAGILILLIGIYNITIYFNVIQYSASNRSIVGMSQLIIGIVFIILTSFSLSQNTNKE